MIELKEEKLENNLIKHYAIDPETNKQYKILQVETNIIYDEAIDVMPCRYTYKATEEIIEEPNLSEEQDLSDSNKEI